MIKNSEKIKKEKGKERRKKEKGEEKKEEEEKREGGLQGRQQHSVANHKLTLPPLYFSLFVLPLAPGLGQDEKRKIEGREGLYNAGPSPPWIHTKCCSPGTKNWPEFPPPQ